MAAFPAKPKMDPFSPVLQAFLAAERPGLYGMIERLQHAYMPTSGSPVVMEVRACRKEDRSGDDFLYHTHV